MSFDIEIRVMHTSRVSAKAALIGRGNPTDLMAHKAANIGAAFC